MRRWIATVTGIAGIAVVAGGSVAMSKPQPTCAPEGTALTISAIDSEFNKFCLVAPAGEPFTIAFDNQENFLHNVAIYDVNNGNKVLFKGESFTGPKTVTYSVPAQAEGTYQFRCDPHKEFMLGTFVVGNGGPTTTTATPTTSTTTTTSPLPKLAPP
jgi:plastocyanin